jgi:hypothetical protein
MGFFQCAILGIGIAVIVLLSVIAYYVSYYVKQSLSYLEQIRERTGNCYSILAMNSEMRASEKIRERSLKERSTPND